MARTGIAARADVLTLKDGTDLNQVWNEFQSAIDIANDARGSLIDLLAFRTTNVSDVVLQAPSGTNEFEQASEHGVPKASRSEATELKLGYDFKWMDFAYRYTWQYLADATLQQVQALHNGALAADSRLQYRTVLNALFNNVQRSSNETDAPIFPLWNGDGAQIPEYNGSTFGSTHTHYTTTGSTTLDPADVELVINQVLEHGYGEDDGATIVVLANRQEADVIAGWRAGVNTAKFDFIPSDSSVPYLTQEMLVGQRPDGEFQGMKISGQYGQGLIAPTSLVPAGYVAAVAVGGPTPVIGLREHPRETGLRLLPGSTRPNYPITDAYYVHGLGAGVRQRGGAAVVQVTASATYTPPTF